jgi:hypothetical protein
MVDPWEGMDCGDSGGGGVEVEPRTEDCYIVRLDGRLIQPLRGRKSRERK